MLAQGLPRQGIRRGGVHGGGVGSLGEFTPPRARVQVTERDARVDVLRPDVDGELVRLPRERVARLLGVHLAEPVERHREVALVPKRAEVARLRGVQLALLQELVRHGGGAPVPGVAELAQGGARDPGAGRQGTVVGEAHGFRGATERRRRQNQRDERRKSDARERHYRTAGARSSGDGERAMPTSCDEVRIARSRPQLSEIFDQLFGTLGDRNIVCASRRGHSDGAPRARLRPTRLTSPRACCSRRSHSWRVASPSESSAPFAVPRARSDRALIARHHGGRGETAASPPRAAGHR